MTTDPILARVQAIVAAVAGPARAPADVGHDTCLTGGGYWLDSVDLLEVLVACEREFGLRLRVNEDPPDAAPMTLGRLAEIIRRALA